MSRGRNKKYSKELKLKAVQSYLRGEGSLRQVCREYEIKDKKPLRAGRGKSKEGISP